MQDIMFFSIFASVSSIINTKKNSIMWWREKFPLSSESLKLEAMTCGYTIFSPDFYFYSSDKFNQPRITEIIWSFNGRLKVNFMFNRWGAWTVEILLSNDNRNPVYVVHNLLVWISNVQWSYRRKCFKIVALSQIIYLVILYEKLHNARKRKKTKGKFH